MSFPPVRFDVGFSGRLFLRLHFVIKTNSIRGHHMCGDDRSASALTQNGESAAGRLSVTALLNSITSAVSERSEKRFERKERQAHRAIELDRRRGAQADLPN
jgi:hypothetical protein